MTTEKIAVQYETIYIANDGRQWNSEMLCKQYEELLADPSPIQNLKFFDNKGNSIDVFSLGCIPCFCYLVLTSEIKKYHWSVVKAIIGNRENDECSYDLPHFEGVWYNDWSNAFNGGCGSNGWARQSSIQSLENEIASCQRKINLLKKIQKTP